MKLRLNFKNSGGLARQLGYFILFGSGIRILGMGGAFLVGVQLARYLGPDGYGVYGTILAVASILAVILTLGTGQFILRETAAAVADENYTRFLSALKSIGFIILSTLSFFLIILIIFVTFSDVLESYVGESYLIYILLITISIIINTIIVSIGTGFKEIIFTQCVSTVVFPLVFSVMLFYNKNKYSFSEETAFICFVISTVIVTVILFGKVIYVQRGCFNLRESLIPLKSVSKMEFVKFSITDISRAFEASYPIILIGIVGSAQAAGEFRVGFSVYTALSAIPAVMFTVSAPFISELYTKRDYEKLQKVCALSALISTLYSFFILVIFYFFGHKIIVLFFGHEYQYSAQVLLIYLFNQIFISFFGITSVLLSMTHREGVNAVLFPLSNLVGFLMCILLVQKLGSIGAAYSHLAMVLTWFSVLFIMYKKQLVVDPTLFAVIPYVISIIKRKK